MNSSRRSHAELRFKGKLNLPGPLSEAEILEFFQQAAAESSREYVSLLGAGAYSHYRPVVVDALLSRGEFFTAYTPYQAEIAQGTLQAMFEFQTLMTQLTGQEVSNASLYDGSTATTEAALMALRVTRRQRVVLARTLHPEYRQILRTYVQNQDVELVEVPYAASGQIDTGPTRIRRGRPDCRRGGAVAQLLWRSGAHSGDCRHRPPPGRAADRHGYRAAFAGRRQASAARPILCAARRNRSECRWLSAVPTWAS